MIQNIEASRVCCFTGHRPEKITPEEESILKKRLDEEIERAIFEGYILFVSGMSRGFDLWAAQSVLALKEDYPHIQLEAALPCIGQDKGWTEKQREEFHHILKQTHYQSCLSQEYTPGCMHMRNRYMVDKSTRLIAYYTGVKTGGTAYTYRYALKKGLYIVNLYPLNAEQLCLSAELDREV